MEAIFVQKFIAAEENLKEKRGLKRDFSNLNFNKSTFPSPPGITESVFEFIEVSNKICASHSFL